MIEYDTIFGFAGFKKNHHVQFGISTEPARVNVLKSILANPGQLNPTSRNHQFTIICIAAFHSVICGPVVNQVALLILAS